MSAKGLMLLGGLGGLALLIAFSFTPVGGSTMAVFALGALFGKGYGIWEERERARPQDAANEIAKLERALAEATAAGRHFYGLMFGTGHLSAALKPKPSDYPQERYRKAFWPESYVNSGDNAE